MSRTLYPDELLGLWRKADSSKKEIYVAPHTFNGYHIVGIKEVTSGFELILLGVDAPVVVGGGTLLHPLS